MQGWFLNKMFKCDMCGECCRNIGLSEVYAFLDDGTGKCRYLEDNKCSIYSERPLLCRIDDCYDVYFSTYLTRDEYYSLNYETCKALQFKAEQLLSNNSKQKIIVNNK